MKEQIKHITNIIFSQIGLVVKSAVKHPFFKKYLLLSFLFFLIFLVTTFPLEAVFRNAISNIEKESNIKIQINSIDASLIGETSLEKINVQLPNAQQIKISRAIVDVSFNPITLFISNRIKGSMDLNKISIENKTAHTDLSVNAQADISIGDDGIIDEGSMNLMGQKLKINILKPESLTGSLGFPLPINSLVIPSFLIEAQAKKGRIEIKKGTFNGNMVRGSLNGSIIQSPKYRESKINLTLLIDADSKILADFRELIQSYVNPQNKIPILLTGTLGRPKVQLQK